MANIDLDKLKELFNEQSANFNKRFDDVNKRFDDVDKRFDDVDKRFDDVDKRFSNVETGIGDIEKVLATKMATKDDLTDLQDEMMRHMGVLIEEVNHKLDLLVEGRVATHERIDMDKEENEKEHSQLEKMSLINSADISGLDQRVTRLEQNPLN